MAHSVKIIKYFYPGAPRGGKPLRPRGGGIRTHILGVRTLGCECFRDICSTNLATPRYDTSIIFNINDLLIKTVLK